MATATAARNWTDQFRSSFQEIEVNPLEEGATALMYACQQENVDQLQSILRKKPEAVRERDRTLKTVLHYCAENATLSCAEIILNVAPDIVDAADEDGYTTLHLAVIAGNIPLVNFLISKSADINALDSERHSVIHWATVCGEVELLEILLKCNANPSTPDVHGGYPIHYAAQMCGAISEMSNDSRLGMAVLRVLLHHNVDVNVVDHDGRQPVLWAASAGSSDAVIALINAGASVRAHDKDGLTALHCAASRGHTDCLETLIELCAADVDVIDNNGCSPLFYSVTLGHADATQLLLQCGANPNRQDRKGRTPAHCGAAKGQFETLRILKKHNGNLWIKNIKGDYCLQEAVNSGRKDLVKWLLSQRPDAVNASNSDGRCPLHIAAITNNIEMCKILLDYQSLVNPIMRTNKGDLMTPLDAALHKGNRGCAKYLQLHGGVPASKLTSYSAAVRGPHRVETHSDYQGSPEGKLEAPYHARSSRSLDTSPSGYQSRGRKVQVRIRADVSSGNLAEAFTNTTELHHRHRGKRDHEVGHDRSSFSHRKQHDRANEFCSLSSDSVSSTDASECSSENDHRVYRRRRRRRQYNNRKSKEHRAHSKTRKHSRSRSRSKCRCSEEERDKSDDRRCKVKVQFQKESTEDPVIGENLKVETKKSESGIHQTVTALVHREDEQDAKDSKKPSESSENGFQEIQYQKLDTEVTDTDVFEDSKVTESKKGDSNIEDATRPDQLDAVKTDTFSDAFGDYTSIPPGGDETESRQKRETSIIESTGKDKTGGEDASNKTTISKNEDPAFKSRKDVLNEVSDIPDNIVEVKMKTDTTEGQAFGDENINRLKNDEGQRKDKSHNYEIQTDDGPDSTKSASNALDLDNDVLSVEAVAITNATDMLNLTKTETGKSDSNMQFENEEGRKPGVQFSLSPESDNHRDRTKNVVDDTKSTTENIEDTHLNEGRIPDGLQKSINELEKFKEEKLEEHFTKDKGLICVILDDDETIEIKRRRDPVRSKSEYHSRTRSASRKKEKSTQRRQRRSRSSFEVLSDEGNNDTRLVTQDDSGFEPSPRHCPSTFEDMSNKTKSRIPRATNRYQSEKQKENDPDDINVSSVTQAVQNSLRKYHLERRIFHTLLELKRLQIRAGKSNEQVLVKRLVDDYQKAGLIVGLRTYDGVFSFRHFERYLYEQLRILQSANRKDIPRIKSSDDFEKLTKALKRTKAGKTLLENVPDNPLFCTHGTHRCIHATHAYTGIPCAAYIAKLDHHKLPKPNENYRCFLPRIDGKNPQPKNPGEIAKSLKHVDPSKPVTLELIHGTEKQIISLPTEKLDKNKRYYVTFTIKGANNQDKSSSDGEKDLTVAQSGDRTD